MAITRDAAIRVNMRATAFASGLNNMVNKTAMAGRKMGRSLREPISAGLKSAKESIADIGSGIKSTISMAATLGGAISVGGAAKTAIEAEVAYLQLADALTTFTDQTYEAAEAQSLVEKVADKTKVPIDGLRTSLLQLASVSGKVDIESLLERSAEQARRLGMEGEFISRVYTRLVAKGVAKTAVEAENLTEQFNTLFRKMLGVDLDEAIDPADVAELAGFINTTGNSAGEMLRLISLGGEKIAKDFGKANEIVEELGLSLRQTKGIEEMTKKLKLPKDAIDANKSALENMLSIADLGQKKFKDMANALAGDVAGEAIKQIIGVEFFAADVTKKEWDLRVEELRKQMSDLGSLAVDRKRIEEADARHKKTTQATVDDAMNTLAKSFADPDMQKAISDLAKHLPDLAKAIASLVSFIAENPLAAASIGIGGKVGMGFLGGFVKDAGPKIFQKLFGLPGVGGLGGAAGIGGAAGAGGIGGVAGSGAELGLVFRGLGKAGKGVTGWLNKQVKPLAGGKGGLAGSAMMAAGALTAAAGAGVLLGDQIRKAFVDPKIEEGFEKTAGFEQEARDLQKDLAKNTTLEEKRAVLQKARERGSAVRDETGTLFKGMGAISAMFGGTDVTAGAEKSFSTVAIDAEMAIRKQMADRLQKTGQFNQEWNEKLFTSMGNLDTVMKEFATTMGSINRNAPSGSGTTRGPAKLADNKPGFEE